MVGESHDDEVGKRDVSTSSIRKDETTSRRSVLKSFGLVTGGILGGGVSSAAASTDYRTITVDAYTTERISVGDDETLENVLIDVTAPGAFVQISAMGSNWTVRNVGVRGRVTERDGEDSALFIPQVDSGSTGLVENVYFGDGTDGNNRINGMWVAHSHAGTLTMRHMNVGHWADNGFYASDPGNPAVGGQMGEVHIERCYAHNNNISSYRIGSPGSYVKDSVAEYTGDTPANSAGIVHSRGIWAKEQSGLRAIDCDIGNPTDIAVQASDDGNITLDNCRLEGANTVYTKDGSEVTGSSVGAPDLTPPAGVPTSAEEAAAGTSTAGTSPGSTSGSDGSDSTSDPRQHTLVVTTDEGGPLVEYEFTVDGSASKGTDSEGNDAVAENGDGTVTVTGAVGNGYADDYTITGALTSWSANVGDEHYRVLLDGTELDVSREATLSIEGRYDAKANYEFSVSGFLQKYDADDATVDDHDTVDGSTASGHVWGGTDCYRLFGGLADFWSDGPVVVRLDGEEIDPAEISSDLENVLTIHGDRGKAAYEFSVSGDLEKSVDADATVDDQDTVDGSTASGHVWGWKDSYRFSGEITDFRLDGDASVYLNGQVVDLDG